MEVLNILVKLKMPHKNFNNSKISPLKEIVALHFFLELYSPYIVLLCVKYT